jgi:Lrp/AsnC family leucine-responsive transcriptional regulator
MKQKGIDMNPMLDKTDLRILYELDLNCRIAETRLAKIVGKSKEAVRYRIKNLNQAGIIKGYSMFFDVAKLGFEGYKIYLKVREVELKQKFVQELKSRPDIFWLSMGDGAWDIAVTFLSKNITEFYNKKNELYSKYKDLVLLETDASLVEGMIFPKKFLLGGEENLQAKPAFLLSNSPEIGVDLLERRLLGLLLKNSRAKLVELAEMCDTSIEVVRNRIKRMEEKGIIQRYSAELDYRKLGMEFYKAFLYTQGLTAKIEKRIYEMARKHPNVLTYIKTIAPWSIELEIMAENYAHYNKIINQIRCEFSDVLTNVESANMATWHEFPAKQAIFY